MFFLKFFSAEEIIPLKSVMDAHYGRVVEYWTPIGSVQVLGRVEHGIIVSNRTEQCLLDSGREFPLSEEDNLKAWELPGSNHWPPPSISGRMKYFL